MIVDFCIAFLDLPEHTFRKKLSVWIPIIVMFNTIKYREICKETKEMIANSSENSETSLSVAMFN